MPKNLNLTEIVTDSYKKVAGASEYGALLARHADSVLGGLSEDPPTSFLFAMRSKNAEMHRLAKEQFGIEVCRYALLIMMAHWERYLAELNAVRRLALAFSEGQGLMRGEEFFAILAKARTEARHRSLDGQLQDLDKIEDANIASGTQWFRGLCAVRVCLTHRAGIVSDEDAALVEGVTWRRLVLLRDDEPVPETEREPHFKAGQQLGFRFEDRVRRWTSGSRVVFSALDIQEIAFTLMCFAGMLHDAINAELRGLIAPQDAITREPHE